MDFHVRFERSLEWEEVEKTSYSNVVPTLFRDSTVDRRGMNYSYRPTRGSTFYFVRAPDQFLSTYKCETLDG